MIKACLAALTLASAAAPTLADPVKVGDVTLDKAWTRATPKGADVAAGYLTIHNNGATPDKLTGGAADFGVVEIHEMKSENGVMQMRALPNGLNIPAHTTIRLSPGGYHVMFTHLTKPLVKGDTVKATLTFEHAGSAEVEFPVENAGASGPGQGKGGDMGGMKM